MIRKRQLASLASLLALVLGDAVAAATPAHASSAAIFCTGWTSATYTSCFYRYGVRISATTGG